MRDADLASLVSADAARRLAVIKGQVMDAVPGHVRDVVLFGSRARGDAQDDSDYDVAVLLDSDLAQDWNIRKRIWGLAVDHVVDGFDVEFVTLDNAAFLPPKFGSNELVIRIAQDGVRIP